MNKEALELIDAINKYMEESGKSDYILSIDEQIALERIIKALEKHLEFLINFEIKREQFK